MDEYNFLDSAKKVFKEFKAQIVIATVITTVLLAIAYCAHDPQPECPTAGDVQGIRAEIEVLKSEIQDYRRIRDEDNAVRVEMQNEINQDLMDIHQRIDRKPQSEPWDVNVDGPIDGKYIVTLEYFGYTYQKIVDGKPDSPANMKILVKWEREKMEERDAALSHHKSATQVP